MTTTSPEAEQLYVQQPREQNAKQRPLNQVVSRFPPKLQGLAHTLLFNKNSHAVQRHGHHLTPAHQFARLQWLLDPAFADQWERHDDGSITSSRWNGKPHQVKETAGHYTSPEAVAKPLTAILTAAGRTQQALDTYLDDRAGNKTLVRLFLHPDTTGVISDDVYTVRGAGADTRGRRAVTVARQLEVAAREPLSQANAQPCRDLPGSTVLAAPPPAPFSIAGPLTACHDTLIIEVQHHRSPVRASFRPARADSDPGGC